MLGWHLTLLEKQAQTIWLSAFFRTFSPLQVQLTTAQEGLKTPKFYSCSTPGNNWSSFLSIFLSLFSASFRLILRVLHFHTLEYFNTFQSFPQNTWQSAYDAPVTSHYILMTFSSYRKIPRPSREYR